MDVITRNMPDNRTFANRYGITMDELNNIDGDLRTKFHLMVAGLLGDVKKKRYPRSKRWKEGVPCFLCGGGKDLETYSLN